MKNEEKLRELQKEIENARGDLERSISENDYEVYYEKSLYLDRLIERYLDMKLYC